MRLIFYAGEKRFVTADYPTLTFNANDIRGPKGECIAYATFGKWKVAADGSNTKYDGVGVDLCADEHPPVPDPGDNAAVGGEVVPPIRPGGRLGVLRFAGGVHPYSPPSRSAVPRRRLFAPLVRGVGGAYEPCPRRVG